VSCAVIQDLTTSPKAVEIIQTLMTVSSMKKIIFATFIFLYASGIANAVTIEQLNTLEGEQKNHVYNTIVIAVIENSFDDPDVVTCARDFFFTNYRGLGGSEGGFSFVAASNILEREGRTDMRVQDLVFSLIRNQCIEE